MVRLRELARRFAGTQRAATAVEFALIAPFFLAALLALFQVTVFLFAQQTLQNAAVQAARSFMTGQAQNGNWTASSVRTQICPVIQALFTCSNVVVVVQNYTSMCSASSSPPALYNNGQPIPLSSFPFDPGTPGQVMVVQLVYQWSVISGPLGFVLANLPNSATEIMGASAFRVEPYQS